MTDLDTSIGRVVSALTDENMRENTLLVFMSDNGGNIHAGANNGELRGSKGTALEGGVRVPAFISWPAKIPAAQNISAPIFVQDWMPTLLEIAGAEPVEGLDGVSAWDRLLSKTEIPNREPVVLGTSKSRATYDWPMKLIRKTDGSEPDQLYNVVEDPFETQNLANKNEEMINRLGAYMENLPVKPFVKPKFPPRKPFFATLKVISFTTSVCRRPVNHGRSQQPARILLDKLWTLIKSSEFPCLGSGLAFSPS